MWAAVWLVLAELLFKFSFLLCGEHGILACEARALRVGILCFLRRNLFVWTDGAMELVPEGICFGALVGSSELVLLCERVLLWADFGWFGVT